MGNVFKGMRLVQSIVGISIGITSIARMEKTTEKLIHSVLLLKMIVHWQTLFGDSSFFHIKMSLQKCVCLKGT